MKKKMIFGGIATAAIIVILLLKTCGTSTQKINEIVEKKQTNYIDPPFSNIEVPQEIFEIDASKGGVFKHGTSIITVPNCAFLDKKNNVVQGKVKLAYREINNPVEIMISGIPMEIDEGTGEYLESAGMMEILAWDDNGSLFVNPECKIKINMQANDSDEDYNFYNLDTVNRRWNENFKNIPVIKEVQKIIQKFKEPNYEKLASKEGIIKPVKPVLKNKNLFQFKFKTDFTKYPELNIYNGVQWEFVGKKNSENPEKNPWVKSAYWNEMEIVKRKRNGVYKLRLASGSKVFKTTVKPVFDGEDMEYAEYVFNEKYTKYRAFVDKKKEEARIWREKQALQKKTNNIVTKLSREITVEGFGWSNIDRILKFQPQKILAKFIDKKGDIISINRAYLMVDSINSLVTYYKNNLDKFVFVKNKKNSMIVIDSQANVYVVKDNIFRNINKLSKEYKFKLTEPQKIESEEDIRKLLKQV